MTKRAEGKASNKPPGGPVKGGELDVLKLAEEEGTPHAKALARVTFDPLARHAILASSFASKAFGNRCAPLVDRLEVLDEELAKAANGNLNLASRILASQAVSLDVLFTEMARRSGNNMGQYPDAADRYMRLALKAQSNCRATLEALAKLHQPREQTVRHVHVNEGGQAVIADQFHHHAGGKENARSADQPHAPGTGPAGTSPALPGPDPLGQGVPITGGEGQPAMPNARGSQFRGT